MSAGVAVGGSVAPGFEVVEKAFVQSFESGLELGASFAAWREGEPVVDLWAGAASRDLRRRWTADTPVMIFSGAKGLVAACVLKVVEDGALDLDAKVAAYWPEFAAGGKSQVTVLQAVTHRAGVPAVRAPVALDALVDDRAMASVVADTAPMVEIGLPTYHALTYGWICGELIRRVTGTSIGSYFQEQFAVPLALDVWIGCPQAVAARAGELVVANGELVGPESARPEGKLVWENPPFLRNPLVWNAPQFLCTEIPAVNAVGTARSLARFYGCLANGGSLAGTSVLEPATIEAACRDQFATDDALFNKPIRYGVGFQLPTEANEFGTAAVAAFGHGGAGGSIHGAWPSLRTGFSYAMNRLSPDPEDQRGRAILDSLHAALSRYP